MKGAMKSCTSHLAAGRGASAEDDHKPRAGRKRIDHVIEFIGHAEKLPSKPEPTRLLDGHNLQLIGPLAAQHDPGLAKSRADADRRGREQLDCADRTDGQRPVHDIDDRGENGARPRGDTPGHFDLHRRILLREPSNACPHCAQYCGPRDSSP
jgi:hypothetical protein